MTALPTYLEPVSMPSVKGCVKLVHSYNNLIVNGHFETTFALFCLSKTRTLAPLCVGISGCPFISNTYTNIMVLLSFKNKIN